MALHLRDHGYDLREYAESHWSAIGPQLLGKLHFYCGEMDNWCLLPAYFAADIAPLESYGVMGRISLVRFVGRGHQWRPGRFGFNRHADRVAYAHRCTRGA